MSKTKIVIDRDGYKVYKARESRGRLLWILIGLAALGVLAWLSYGR